MNNNIKMKWETYYPPEQGTSKSSLMISGIITDNQNVAKYT